MGFSFDSIDPTPCHASAHPQKHESTIAFFIQDTESNNQNEVTVSEITTRHIRRLASSASDFLGKKISAAVISVPTNFMEKQKEALTKASQAAGVEVLQIISEPIAAVLAYDARPEAELKDKIIVVADLGGTRSDIAVIASRGGMYSILSTSHDYGIAGAQLDQILVDHFAKEFIKKNKTDPRQNQRSLAKLKLEAEATKKALSLGGNAALSVESLADGVDFASTINRTRYEMLAGKVFGSFTRVIEETIRKAGLDVLDIDEVIFSPQPYQSGSAVGCSDTRAYRHLGHTLRWNIPHTTRLTKLATALPTIYSNSLNLYLTHGNRPILASCPRCRHPSLPHPGI